MTTEQAQRVAMFMRRKAAGLSPNCIELAGELREAADIVEAAAAPPEPTAAEPRCERCKWWREIEDLRPKGVGRCVRHPPAVGIDGASAQWPRTVTSEWCGEFKSREVEA